MNKKFLNMLYSYLGAAFIAVIIVDTLLGFHPAGNLIGGVILLFAVYKVASLKN